MVGAALTHCGLPFCSLLPRPRRRSVRQWHDEIERFTKPGTLSVYVYYNKRSHVRARDLKAYDVVLTTFPVLERTFR